MVEKKWHIMYRPAHDTLSMIAQQGSYYQLPRSPGCHDASGRGDTQTAALAQTSGNLHRSQTHLTRNLVCNWLHCGPMPKRGIKG